MPIRIYALAKQLKLDSKVLVDVCNKAGVTGKGSALASLTDEEVEKITAFVSGVKSGKAGGPQKASAGAKASRPSIFRREDYIAPSGTAGGKIPVLPSKPQATKKKPEDASSAPAPSDEKEREKEKDKGKDKGDRGPSIKLAPMPAATKPPQKSKKGQPAPQKPEIKLPLDVIRAGKLGSKPLSEHLRKHEQKRMADEAAAKASPHKGAPPKPLPTDEEKTAAGRERPRRGGRHPAPKDDDSITLGGREQRQLKRKKAASARRRKSSDDEETTSPVIRKRTRIRRTGANTAAPRRESVVVVLPCTVRGFSEAIGVPARVILGKLLELGMMSNIAATLDAETAELLAAELGANVKFQQPVDLERKIIEALEQEDDPETLLPRPPIVTFLGHVDHGKTSLLDRIIGTDVVSGEKGGITQHIRAYRVEKDGRAVTFVDTPGHEAFTEMRARGANVTDIAVLVVAADDGVMPQTEEAISHARAADVPIIVALNKIDLPGVNPQRVFEQLAANELLPSEWGGETEVVQTSATTGAGIDKLMETLLTVAELNEYKAAWDRPACGACLEAELHEGRGVVAKLLVRKGTLRVGDVLVCGSAVGRVKAITDTLDPKKQHDEVGPSTPVNVTGLDSPPDAGDRFYVLDDISQARQLAEKRAAGDRQRELSGAVPHVTLENLFERLGEENQVQTLNIILRADVRGSIEAIRKELSKLEHPEVQIKILQATVGGVSEADVHLAHASDAVIIGFSVVPDEGARVLADKLGVQIRRYDIIYQVTDDLKAALEGMLKPERQERDLGRALVQQIFHISRLGTVAGCRILSGTVQRDGRARLIRDSRVLGDYPLDSLKREKDDAREVREGFECGIKLAGFNDVKEGDILEVYKIEEIARKL
ncbi:MAG: translation initiation factor IF-2 [Pirellulales bacterium]|nr:translation initiation factor IF-2 [Pirellulales bacterium]